LNAEIKGFYTARKEAGESQNDIRNFSGKNYLGPKQAQVWVEGYKEIIRGIRGFVRFLGEKANTKK
jgi:hypothetical protein